MVRGVAGRESPPVKCGSCAGRNLSRVTTPFPAAAANRPEEIGVVLRVRAWRPSAVAASAASLLGRSSCRACARVRCVAGCNAARRPGRVAEPDDAPVLGERPGVDGGRSVSAHAVRAPASISIFDIARRCSPRHPSCWADAVTAARIAAVPFMTCHRDHATCRRYPDANDRCRSRRDRVKSSSTHQLGSAAETRHGSGRVSRGGRSVMGRRHSLSCRSGVALAATGPQAGPGLTRVVVRRMPKSTFAAAWLQNDSAPARSTHSRALGGVLAREWER
jgi:hypothetical protein